jgi:hypothetical protein
MNSRGNNKTERVSYIKDTYCNDKEYTWWFLQKEELLMPRPFYLLYFI